MSDGQTETNEMIAAQNAGVSIRLERGESVKWHDGTQWQTGVVLTIGKLETLYRGMQLVQTCDGIYAVDVSALDPYGPRCEECGGEGTVSLSNNLFGAKRETCPACRGSGRKKA